VPQFGGPLTAVEIEPLESERLPQLPAILDEEWSTAWTTTEVMINQAHASPLPSSPETGARFISKGSFQTAAPRRSWMCSKQDRGVSPEKRCCSGRNVDGDEPPSAQSGDSCFPWETILLESALRKSRESNSLLQTHPVAAAFPPLGGAAFDALLEDMAERGQRLPIVLYDGKIWDGRARHAACTELGLKPWLVPLRRKSPVELYIRLNYERAGEPNSPTRKAIVDALMQADGAENRATVRARRGTDFGGPSPKVG
jgi:hypothetical protein